MRFVEILHPKPRRVNGAEVASPRRSNEEMTTLFAQIVEETPGLHPWRRDTSRSEGTYLVIGAVTWSGYDLRALDELAVVAASMEPHDFRSEVFDIDRVFQDKGSSEGEKPVRSGFPALDIFR